MQYAVLTLECRYRTENLQSIGDSIIQQIMSTAIIYVHGSH